MPMQATTTTPLFAAVLTPNRGLDRRIAWSLAGLAVMLFAAPVLLLASIAAEVIVILMGLAVLGIVIGLIVGLRRGKRHERVTVWRDQIEWQVTDSAGQATMRRFEPAKIRLLLTRDEHEKTIAVRLRGADDTVELGAFLTPEDKSSFAKALGSALRKARAEQSA